MSNDYKLVINRAPWRLCQWRPKCLEAINYCDLAYRGWCLNAGQYKVILWSWSSTFIHSFIPLACAECDDSLPFSGASSIHLCYVLFPANLLHQLFFHPLSPHLAIYFLVHLSIFLFSNSYIIPFWEIYFLPFSVHAQTNIIYLTLLALLQWVFNTCINFFIG